MAYWEFQGGFEGWQEFLSQLNVLGLDHLFAHEAEDQEKSSQVANVHLKHGHFSIQIQVEILFFPGFGLPKLLFKLHEVESTWGTNDGHPTEPWN